MNRGRATGEAGGRRSFVSPRSPSAAAREKLREMTLALPAWGSIMSVTGSKTNRPARAEGILTLRPAFAHRAAD